MTNGATPDEIRQFVVLAIVGVVAAVAGGHAGWVNTRRTYNKVTWFVVLLPTTSYFAAWITLFMLGAPKLGAPEIGSFVLWHLVVCPLISISVGFGWALAWLTRCLCRVVRDRRGNSA
jgi:hypothetical protein